MTHDTHLITQCYRALATWPDWRQGRAYEDSHGRYGFAATSKRGTHVCAAKAYLHDGQASFMQRLINRARRMDAVLTLFVGRGPPTAGSAYVFDADTVQSVGEAFTIANKSGVECDARQLDAEEWGVLLGDFTAYRVRDLPTPEADPPPEGTLHKYGVQP